MKLNQGLPFDNRGETKQIVVFEKKGGKNYLLTVDYLKILPPNKAQSYWKKQSIFKWEEKNHSCLRSLQTPRRRLTTGRKKSREEVKKRAIYW